MKSYRVDFTPDSQDIPQELLDQLYENTYNGPLLEFVNEEDPSAWDAGFSIEVDEKGEVTRKSGGKLLVIHGSAGPSGYGRVKIEVPLKDTSYHFVLEPNDDVGFAPYKEQLEKLGYKFTEIHYR